MSNETQSKFLRLRLILNWKPTFTRERRRETMNESPSAEQAIEFYTTAQGQMGEILDKIEQYQPVEGQQLEPSVLHHWQYILDNHEDLRRALFNGLNYLTDHCDSADALSARSNAKTILSQVKAHSIQVDNASSRAREDRQRMKIRQAIHNVSSSADGRTGPPAMTANATEASCWEARGVNDLKSSSMSNEEEISIKISVEMEADPQWMSNPSTGLGRCKFSIHPNQNADGLIVRIKPTPGKQTSEDPYDIV